MGARATGDESALAWLAANAIEDDALPADLADRHDHYLEAPAAETGGTGEQVLERPAKTEFVLHALPAKGRQRPLVFADQRMVGEI